MLEIERKPLFPLSQIVATPGALAALEKAGQNAASFLARHTAGDWGDLWPEDVSENRLGLECGFRLMSTYITDAEERVWIVTEADRSATTILLPEEY